MMSGRIGTILGNVIFPYLLYAGCAPPFVFIGLLAFGINLNKQLKETDIMNYLFRMCWSLFIVPEHRKQGFTMNYKLHCTVGINN